MERNRISPLRAAVIWVGWMFLTQVPISFGLGLLIGWNVLNILAVHAIGLGVAGAIIGMIFGMIEVSEEGTGPLRDVNDYIGGLLRSIARWIMPTKGTRIIPPTDGENLW